jgi:NADH:ubiquinone oxidoreductase subunit 3 (subunit A)
MDMLILLSPPVAFFLFMLLGYGLYALGRGMAGAPVPDADPHNDVMKGEPYACGQEYQAQHFQFGYQKFFIAALFFTVMHVAIMAIATVPSGPSAYKAIIYLAVIALSISILYVDFD